MDKELYQTLRKIEEETKLLKVDASKEEVQQIIRENVLLKEEIATLTAEKESLQESVELLNDEKEEISHKLKRILKILSGDNKPTKHVLNNVDTSAIKNDLNSIEVRRSSLRNILKENANIFN